MAPTTQEEGGEGSGSRSSARRRRRRRSTPARRPSPTPPTVSTRLEAGDSEPASSSHWRRAGAAKEGSKKSKRSRAAGKGSVDEESAARRASDAGGQEREVAAAAASASSSSAPSSAVSKRTKKKRSRAKEQSKKRKRDRAADEGRVGEIASSRSKRRNMGDPEAALASASAASEQATSSEASSAVSSPIRQPYIHRAVIGVDSWGRDILEPFIKIDPAIVEAHAKLKAKYFAKQRKQLKLATLDEHIPHSYLDGSLRGSATEMVLRVAKVVLGLSSYIDGTLLTRTSGFLIDWDEEKKFGTVLTSALLIRSKSPSFDEWLGIDEYAPHAEVHAHLLDKHDTVVVAELMHYNKHYNFALFKIKMDIDPQITSFSTEVRFGQEVFAIGRDENMHLSINHGSVQHKGPSSFERHHYMFTSCEDNKCGPGGPVVDLYGQILGMVNLPEMTFIPSAIILKCLRMLKKIDCIPRVHTGMKFSAIKLLDPVHIEKIIRKCSIDKGLIVTEVSGGSVAEKVGIRIGDIVESWNGESVSTTVELESLLLRMSEEHLDNGAGIGSSMDVPVGIFRVRNDSRCTKMLTVKISDDVEVVATGECAVSAANCATMSDDDVDSGQETS